MSNRGDFPLKKMLTGTFKLLYTEDGLRFVIAIVCTRDDKRVETVVTGFLIALDYVSGKMSRNKPFTKVFDLECLETVYLTEKSFARRPTKNVIIPESADFEYQPHGGS